MSEDLVRVEPPDALRPARAASAELLVLPRLVVDAGPVAVARFLEFFAARIANRRTRAAYAQQIAGHASPKTTKLYDRTADTITVDEIERIVI